jgi:hypothetical protein
MNVKDLINILKKENQKARVVVEGYESGYDEVSKISTVSIEPNPDKGDSEKDDKWWDGEFFFSDKKNAEIAICLPRKS